MAAVSENTGVARLYKYRQDNDHTLQLLKNQELYLSFIRDFNDPFDCRIIADFSGSDEKSWESLTERKQIPEPIKQGALGGLRSIGFDANEAKRIYGEAESRTYIICCFSEIRNSVLMWSHYARSHHGICVGFEVAAKDEFLFLRTDDCDLKRHPQKAFRDWLRLSKVIYCDECPKPYNVFNDPRRIITFLKTKAKDWEHEQEHRIILPHGEINKNVVRFHRSSLKEIILGCKIRDDFKNKLLSTIRTEYISQGYSVDVYQSSLHESRYTLSFEKLEIG
jgi:hypothetical protein